MGAGIGWCFAVAGYNVCLNDVSPVQLEKGGERLERIRVLYVQEGLASEAGTVAAARRTVLTQEWPRSKRRAVRARGGARSAWSSSSSLFAAV